jgi:hypothetical protein
MVMALTGVALVSVVACSSSDAASPGDSSSGKSSSSGKAGDDDDGGGSSSGAAIVVPITDYAKALCARIAKCQPGVIEQRWGDATTCAQNLSTANYPSEHAANSGMTSTAEAACAAKLANDACGTVEPPECDLDGTQTTGGSCYVGQQCATGLCWFTTQPTAQNPCGKCQAKANAGEDCTNTDCVDGTTCDISADGKSGTKKCIAPPGAGGDCTNVDCLTGFVCIGNKCVAAIKPDQPCTPSTGQNDQDPCDSSAICVNAKCTTLTFTAKVGDPCGGATGCNHGACFQGKCVAFAKLGEACDQTGEAPPACEVPMLCYQGKCTYSDVPVCK